MNSAIEHGVRRLAVICDYQEEQWPSMEGVANLLYSHLRSAAQGGITFSKIQPRLQPRFQRLPGAGETRFCINADRLVNRFWDYPRRLASDAPNYDLFHVIDHSYSQLLLKLPAGRGVVTCHDLDTFACVQPTTAEPRSFWFREMTRRSLRGFLRAAHVICVSKATRSELLNRGWFPRERVSAIPNGVHPCCSPHPDTAGDADAEKLIGESREEPLLLHVGSTIPRKRIEFLLAVFAAVRDAFPGARLLRAGGPLSPAQQAIAARLGVAGSIVTLPFISNRALAAIYRRAWLLLQPSDAEGFGLPVIEAQACGCPVVASGIPALLETGGPAVFCPVGNLDAWRAAIGALLAERRSQPEQWRRRRDAAIQHAQQFTWRRVARETLGVYESLLAAGQLCARAPEGSTRLDLPAAT